MAGYGTPQVKLTVAQIERALRESGGFVSYAAKMLNITSGAVTQRVQKSEHLQKILDEIKESYIDICETALLKKIKAGDLGAICFYLKCQAKHRGYVERQEITGVDGGPVKIQKIERVIIDPKESNP